MYEAPSVPKIHVRRTTCTFAPHKNENDSSRNCPTRTRTNAVTCDLGTSFPKIYNNATIKRPLKFPPLTNYQKTTMKTSLILLLLTQITGISASCYDNWFDLMTDVEDADADETFVVCPGTDLVPEDIMSGGEVFTDIWFYQSGIRLLCGENGQSRNLCKFKGGLSHLYVPDDDIENIYVSVSRLLLSLGNLGCWVIYSNAL